VQVVVAVGRALVAARDATAGTAVFTVVAVVAAEHQSMGRRAAPAEPGETES
jgi:hypothetical protein